MLASLTLLALGIFGPGIATGRVRRAPARRGRDGRAAVGAAGTAVAVGAAATGVGGAVAAGAHGRLPPSWQRACRHVGWQREVGVPGGFRCRRRRCQTRWRAWQRRQTGAQSAGRAAASRASAAGQRMATVPRGLERRRWRVSRPGRHQRKRRQALPQAPEQPAWAKAAASPPAAHPRRDHRCPRAARWRRRLRQGPSLRAPTTDAIHRRTDHAIQETAGALRRHAAACHAVPNRRQVWDDRIGSARVQAKNWRFMAFGCLTLALLMAGGLVWRSAQSIVALRRGGGQRGQVRAVGEAATPYRPNDAQTAHHIARFVTLVRSLSIDPSSSARTGWTPTTRPTKARPCSTTTRGSTTRSRASERVGDGADHQRRACQRHVFQRALDGRRQRRCGGPGTWTAVVSIVLTAAHRRTPAQEPAGHLRQRPFLEPRAGFFRRTKP